MKRIFAILASILFLIAVAVQATQTIHVTPHGLPHAKQHPVKKLDINTADAKSLSHLKGLGSKKAKAIVAYRKKHGHFKTLADLTHIKGIGKATLARLLKKNPGRLMANP